MDSARRDTRHCPSCGACGILPLDQPHDDRDVIVNPVMICPVCDVEFRADGMKWLGSARVDPSALNEDVVGQIVDWLSEALDSADREGSAT